MAIRFDLPVMQVEFARSLKEMQATCLQDALVETAASVDIAELDEELHRYVDAGSLRVLVGHGIRGELLFAVPLLLKRNPRLLAYYRLLLGYSQKAFYGSATGAAAFKPMEVEGTVPNAQEGRLSELCEALNESAAYLLTSLETEMITKVLFNDLTLLTFGTLLRGRASVKKGASAMESMTHVIQGVVGESVVRSDARSMEIRNSAGRLVQVVYAADPDIVFREEIAPGVYRNMVAVEVKGGSDYSNIHNRIGEAEKSHQKARKDGYVECWTVVNVDKLDIGKARKESPSTNRFYRLSELLDSGSGEYRDFAGRVRSIVGI